MMNIPWQVPFTLSLEGTHLQGIHNEENMLAAILASTVMDAAPSAIQEVIHSYRGLPHRVEWVCAWRGIDFYDDSKGTNVGAVVKAIENFDRPILLLLGGRDKLGSYRPVGEALQAKGKGLLSLVKRLRESIRNLEDGFPLNLSLTSKQLLKMC